MSQYAEFFVRHETTFLPIASFSRSNYLYQVYKDYLPYEKITALDKPTLLEISNTIQEDVAEIKTRMEELNAMKEDVKGFNNTAEEKLEALNNIRHDLAEYQETIKEYSYALYFTVFLQDMCESAYDTKWCDDLKLDSETYIYAGIEVGQPTMEDVR